APQPYARVVVDTLGTLSAMVVHGADGLDEFSPTGPSKYAWLRNGGITTGFLDPRDLRLLPVSLSELSGGDPQRNGEIATKIFSGEPGAHREAVVLNAGAALLAAGKGSDWDEAIGFAEESLASGNARRKLEALCAFTNRG
ncbi:MAG: anthranilate phosphoribosyltransferase, partial [Armatimonadetes bacterium]|nr:anthranilate phosphoribosyltransferase [Armatimonadota bacterium]